jgi:replication-associated recombination protein RarA
MKFEEYISKTSFLHEMPKIPKFIENFEHMILYGPAGSGKYTQMLRIVSAYSKSKLKYERRVTVPLSLQQQSHVIKISDIHYEVNMELLGCNAKVIWHDIFTHIMEMIQNKFPHKTGIIVCTNFHTVHNELLEIFYSYMQSAIKFILVTESVSFLPNAVYDRCKLYAVPKPSPSDIESCLGIEKAYSTSNLATAHLSVSTAENIASNRIIQDIKTTDILVIRDHIYHILVHNLHSEICLWYIFKTLVPNLPREKVDVLLKEWCDGVGMYTKNYRPLFHLEHFVVLIALALRP